MTDGGEAPLSAIIRRGIDDTSESVRLVTCDIVDALKKFNLEKLGGDRRVRLLI